MMSLTVIPLGSDVFYSYRKSLNTVKFCEKIVIKEISFSTSFGKYQIMYVFTHA